MFKTTETASSYVQTGPKPDTEMTRHRHPTASVKMPAATFDLVSGIQLESIKNLAESTSN